MNKVKFLLIVAIFALITTSTGCRPDPPPNIGFRVHARFERLIQGRRVTVPDVYVGLNLQIRSTQGITGGTRESFPNVRTNFYGNFDARDAKAPALWRITETSGDCSGQFVDLYAIHANTLEILCQFTARFPFYADNTTIDVQNPPVAITVYGPGLDTTYGMPTVEYYSEDGTLIGVGHATEVAPDNSWMRGPLPDLSSAESGWSILRVKNANGTDGVYLGDGAIEIINNPPPPPCEPTAEELSSCQNCCSVRAEWDYNSCSCVPY